MSATIGSSKQLEVICEHWHRPILLFVLTKVSHLSRSSTISIHLHSLAMYGGANLLTAPKTRDAPRDSAPPSVCSFNVRAMRKASNAESPGTAKRRKMGIGLHRILGGSTSVEGGNSKKNEGIGFYECFITFFFQWWDSIWLWADWSAKRWDVSKCRL